MEIAFYGGLANNAYVAARAVSGLGHDIVFIRDEGDCFPFSQPVWEDFSFTLPYDEIYGRQWSVSEWKNFENKIGWCPPCWLIEPVGDVSDTASRGAFSFRNAILWPFLRRNTHRQKALEAFRKCDFLFVCGVDAEILAWGSGVPYVIWPHGGDIRFASGLVPFDGRGVRAVLSYVLRRIYLALSYKGASWIGTHDPKGISAGLGNIPYPLEFFPLPMPARLRSSSQAERHSSLRARMREIGVLLPDADLYLFVPSRISFFWKKTDLLLAAIKRLSGGKKCHFIFSGWGEDYKAVKDSLPKERATFLPFALSKPVLFDIFRSTDVVIDQFSLGTYGTSAIEAMSCGVPVMMFIDNQAFYKKGWEPPPVINACTEEEIFQSLDGIASGRIDLERVGEDLFSWFSRTHQDIHVVPKFIERIEKELSGG